MVRLSDSSRVIPELTRVFNSFPIFLFGFPTTPVIFWRRCCLDGPQAEKLVTSLEASLQLPWSWNCEQVWVMASPSSTEPFKSF